MEIRDLPHAVPCAQNQDFERRARGARAEKSGTTETGFDLQSRGGLASELVTCVAGYVRRGLEEPPQREPGRGLGVLGRSPHPLHPAGQEAPDLEEKEEGRVTPRGVTREGPPGEAADAQCHTSILPHTLQTPGTAGFHVLRS